MGALVAFIYIFGGFDSGVNRDYCVLRVTLTLLQAQFSALTEAIGLLMGKEGLIFPCNLSSASDECFVGFFPFCLWVFCFGFFFYCIVLECLIF